LSSAAGFWPEYWNRRTICDPSGCGES